MGSLYSSEGGPQPPEKRPITMASLTTPVNVFDLKLLFQKTTKDKSRSGQWSWISGHICPQAKLNTFTLSCIWKCRVSVSSKSLENWGSSHEDEHLGLKLGNNRTYLMAAEGKLCSFAQSYDDAWNQQKTITETDHHPSTSLESKKPDRGFARQQSPLVSPW